MSGFLLGIANARRTSFVLLSGGCLTGVLLVWRDGPAGTFAFQPQKLTYPVPTGCYSVR